MAAKRWGKLGGEGIEQKGKRTHGHEQQCGESRRMGYKGSKW